MRQCGGGGGVRRAIATVMPRHATRTDAEKRDGSMGKQEDVEGQEGRKKRLKKRKKEGRDE